MGCGVVWLHSIGLAVAVAVYNGCRVKKYRGMGWETKGKELKIAQRVVGAVADKGSVRTGAATDRRWRSPPTANSIAWCI
ncbi:unnamed protein product [Ilex paraguariensis]|uniref:Uncharacterized protein n=1 Tax=Ilex paraguariensis TaxID=185542 RepID=A0ABC8UF77_9AQUA